MNRIRKRGSDVGDIASCLVTKWKELLKQEPDTNQISPSNVHDKNFSGSSGPTVSESDADLLDNKHYKSKHKNGEMNSKVLT